MGRQGDAPGPFEFMADRVVGHILIAGILVGQDAHIAGPLDVVLAADGADAGGVMTVVAGHEAQVGAGDDTFDALRELGDAHAPEGHGVLGRGEQARSPADVAGVEMGCRSDGFRSVFFLGHFFGIVGKACRMLFDEIVVDQVFRDDDMGHGVEEEHVRAALDRQINGGDASCFCQARIDTDDLAALLLGPDDMAGDEGM